jgi:carboxyl-terminal processing protease
MAIDDTSVFGMSIYDVMQRVAGKPNSHIKLTIFREGVYPSLEFRLKRENVTIHPTIVDYVDEGILYMRISTFDQNTYSSMEKKLRSYIKKNNPSGIIIDLRNNPGGLISEAVKVVSMFVEDSTVVYTRGRDESSISEYHSDSDVLKMRNIPIVMLINNGTASAAEIVAGALQDYKKAVVLGTRSFGKGSVQDVIPLEGGSAISITTSLYYTPTGRSIQAEGVVPDIIIEDIEVKKYKEDRAFREENIEGHLERVKDINQTRGSYVVEKIRKKMRHGKEKTCKKCRDDYMIIRAVDLVKGINIYKLAIGNNIADKKQ